MFPDDFSERLLTTLEDLENNNHGYLALAMFYKYWTDDEIYNKFKYTLREAEKWNSYFLTCCLQELKKISSHPVDTENGPEEATFFDSWHLLENVLRKDERGLKVYKFIRQDQLILPEQIQNLRQSYL